MITFSFYGALMDVGKGKWQGLRILTFHLLFDTFCNINPMLKNNDGKQLLLSTIHQRVARLRSTQTEPRSAL